MPNGDGTCPLIPFSTKTSSAETPIKRCHRRCNRTGLCRGCVCVKVGRKCINCLPSKRGSCANTSVPQPPPPTPPVTVQKRCRNDTDLTVLTSNSPFPSTCCVPSIPMASNSAVTNAQGTPITYTVQLGASNSCPPSLEKDSCVPTVSASPSTSMPDIPAYHKNYSKNFCPLKHVLLIFLTVLGS